MDARLENGSRVNVVLSPVALNGPILTIRRFPDHPIGMKELRELGSITEEADLVFHNLSGFFDKDFIRAVNHNFRHISIIN